MKQLTTITAALRDTSKWDFTNVMYSYNRPLSGLPDTYTVYAFIPCVACPLSVMHIYQANPLWSCYNLYIRIYHI